MTPKETTVLCCRYLLPHIFTTKELNCLDQSGVSNDEDDEEEENDDMDFYEEARMANVVRRNNNSSTKDA